LEGSKEKGIPPAGIEPAAQRRGMLLSLIVS